MEVRTTQSAQAIGSAAGMRRRAAECRMRGSGLPPYSACRTAWSRIRCVLSRRNPGSLRNPTSATSDRCLGASPGGIDGALGVVSFFIRMTPCSSNPLVSRIRIGLRTFASPSDDAATVPDSRHRTADSVEAAREHRRRLVARAIAETVGVPIGHVRRRPPPTRGAAPTWEVGGRPLESLGWAWSASSCPLAAGAALARTTRGIGLDLVAIAGLDPWPEIAARAFTARERATVESDEDPTRAAARIWARKEAVLKARGVGLGLEPDRIEVADVGIITLSEGTGDVVRVVDVESTGLPGCVAAVAATGDAPFDVIIDEVDRVAD